MQKGGHSSQEEFLAVRGNNAPLLPEVQDHNYCVTLLSVLMQVRGGLWPKT